MIFRDELKCRVYSYFILKINIKKSLSLIHSNFEVIFCMNQLRNILYSIHR